MTVYVLNRGFDYEGEQTIGVFANKESAVAAARQDHCGEDDSPLREFSVRHGEPYWAEDKDSSTQWYARPFEVK